MPQNGAAAVLYDWEAQLKEDPRAASLQQSIDRILLTSFPSIAARLRKPEPPKHKQEAATATAAAAPPPLAPVVSSTAAASIVAATKPEPALREELDPSLYLTESSSELDSQTEIDPMQALREMEARQARGQPPVPPSVKQNGQQQNEEDADMAMDMDGTADEAEDEDDEQTACFVCSKSDNERHLLVCDGCDGEYHIYCLRPPLPAVPDGLWFCPVCVSTRPDVVAAARAAAGAENESEPMDVDDVALSAEVTRIKQEKVQGLFRSHSLGAMDESTYASTSVGIAQTFENELDKSNELLVHACNCDDQRCANPVFSDFCPHMKRFLRSVCWASHNPKWLSCRIAQLTAELFAHHSLACQADACNVPLCDELRAQEIV